MSKLFKMFQLLGFVSKWAEEALNPDEDGRVRLTLSELEDLAEGICAVFGWKVEITLPKEAQYKVE